MDGVVVPAVSVVEGVEWLGFIVEGGVLPFGRASLIGLELGSTEGPAAACCGGGTWVGC